MDCSDFGFTDSSNPVKGTYSSDTFNARQLLEYTDDNADLFSFVDVQSDFQFNEQALNPSRHGIPQLTSEMQAGQSHTGSSVLSGCNPEFSTMSPLQISTTATSLPAMYYTSSIMTHSMQRDTAEDEECFSPLVSPAINSNQYSQRTKEESSFTPLTSPALHPAPPSVHTSVDQSVSLQRELALIEERQQQLLQQHLRSPYMNAQTPYPQRSPRSRPTAKKQTLRQKIAMSSPQFLPTHGKEPIMISQSQSPQLAPSGPATTMSSMITPATPASLMKLGNAASKLTSPNVTPGPSSSVDNMPSLPAAMLQDDSPRQESGKRRRVSQPLRSQRSMAPPYTSPMVHTHDNIAALVSPLSLRPQQSPRALKPLISPSLQPDGKRSSMLDTETAAAILASKSNYQALREGKAKSLGIDFAPGIHSGIENRRSAHKAAEQKRRDTLKQSFDSLRKEIADAVIEEHGGSVSAEKEKALKQMSKVVLLQHSYEYILRLKSDGRRKDEKYNKLRTEVSELRKLLGLPEKSQEEVEEEAREQAEEQHRRTERLQRLNAVEEADAMDELPDHPVASSSSMMEHDTPTPSVNSGSSQGKK